MHYGELKLHDVANGEGIRVSLFVSGCTHMCKNCFNIETWNFLYGKEYTQDVQNTILNQLGKSYISGFTMIGGEPFEPSNQLELVKLLREIKKQHPNKSIWAYSGYLFDKELLEPSRATTPVTAEILSYVDVLIDGKFEEDKKNLMLNFRGSYNQRVIDVQASLKQNQVVLHSLNNIVKENKKLG